LFSGSKNIFKKFFKIRNWNFHKECKTLEIDIYRIDLKAKEMTNDKLFLDLMTIYYLSTG